MRFLFLILVTLPSFAFAADNICAGDKVYLDSFPIGLGYDDPIGRVVAVNADDHTLTVDNGYGHLYYGIARSQVSVTKGCFGGICVGNTVYVSFLMSGAYPDPAAVVVGINPLTGRYTVRAHRGGGLIRAPMYNVSLVQKCENSCR